MAAHPGGQGSQGAALKKAKGAKELSWQHPLKKAKGAKELSWQHTLKKAKEEN